MINELYPTYEVILFERVQTLGAETCMFPEKPLSEMSLEELRKYATFFANFHYVTDLNKAFKLSDYISFEQERALRDELNEEFNRRVGNDFVSIYDFFDKRNNKEKWTGEIRYQLLVYSGKPQQELGQATMTKNLLEVGKQLNLNASQILELLEISHSYPYFSDTKTTEVNRLIDSIL